MLGPDHPDVARSLNNLADLYERQGRYAEAEPLFERALAIRERAVGPDHPDTATSTNNLASFYQAAGRAADALPLVQRLIASGRAQLRAALPVLLDAQRQQLMPAEKALDDALNVIQRGTQSLGGVCREQAGGAARRRQRPPRRTGAPGSGSRG